MSDTIRTPGIDPFAEKAAADEGRGEGRLRRKGRRKVSYLTVNKIDYVDYKDVAILRRFLTDRGKILPSRQTGNSAKQQRMITRAIKRAREMALLPFVVTDLTDEPRSRSPRPDRVDRYDRAERGDRPAEPERSGETPAT